MAKPIARKARVLVVDDSAVIRRMLTDIISADPAIESVGTAANAALALSKIQQEEPDVITLDVEMPDVSGLELLAKIRKIAPRLPVIMFSALTHRAAATTLEALALGASEYVTKPSGTGSREAANEHVRSELLPKIKALAGLPAGMAAVAVTGAAGPRAKSVRKTPISRPDVLAVGCSTGGPNALAAMLQAIPANFPLPVVIVQHMPPLFTKLLAERLSSACPLKFREAEHGDTLSPGTALIAPGDHHLTLAREGTRVVAALNQAPPENSCRPAVDVLFRSVAAVYAANSLAVVLTGMGQDGLKGCEVLQTAGAQIVVQDEASSVVWGMPGFIARAGLADEILPLADIATCILRRCVRRLHPAERTQSASAAS